MQTLFDEAIGADIRFGRVGSVEASGLGGDFRDLSVDQNQAGSIERCEEAWETWALSSTVEAVRTS